MAVVSVAVVGIAVVAGAVDAVGEEGCPMDRLK